MSSRDDDAPGLSAGAAEPSAATVVVTQPQRSGLAMFAKRLLQLGFRLWVLPQWMKYRLMSRLVDEPRAFMAASESLAGSSGLWGVYVRQAFYSQALAACGKDVYIGWQTMFSMSQAKLGEGCYIGHRCGLGYADVGAKVMLADGVQVLSGGKEHGTTAEEGETHQDLPQTFNQVTIGEGAWIGTNAVIMADVGAHCVIGAGAVVARAIPPYSVAVGAPARVVKSLKSED
ncbi:MAG: acyltransferase [Pseudomonadota bacterium]